jgi:hypothetical protein
MSNNNCGKKTSKQRDAFSYFQKPQSKNPISLHDSISFEQPISESQRDVNSYENASNIYIIDDETGSSSDQIEMLSPKVDNNNVEGFSLEGNTNHSQSWKRKKGQWDIGRQFQSDWVSKFPFSEPIPPTNEKEASREVRCIICSWKLGKTIKLQMKLDTIEKRAGKVYDILEKQDHGAIK